MDPRNPNARKDPSVERAALATTMLGTAITDINTALRGVTRTLERHDELVAVVRKYLAHETDILGLQDALDKLDKAR